MRDKTIKEQVDVVMNECSTCDLQYNSEYDKVEIEITKALKERENITREETKQACLDCVPSRKHEENIFDAKYPDMVYQATGFNACREEIISKIKEV